MASIELASRVESGYTEQGVYERALHVIRRGEIVAQTSYSSRLVPRLR